MGKSKTSDNIQIKIKITNLSQEPPVSSKGQIQGYKTDIFYSFKICLDSQNSEHIWVIFKMPNPQQEPETFSTKG